MGLHLGLTQSIMGLDVDSEVRPGTQENSHTLA